MIIVYYIYAWYLFMISIIQYPRLYISDMHSLHLSLALSYFLPSVCLSPFLSISLSLCLYVCLCLFLFLSPALLLSVSSSPSTLLSPVFLFKNLDAHIVSFVDRYLLPENS